MQTFVAELSSPVEKTEFERAWYGNRPPGNTQPKVEFAFAGCRVSAVIHSDFSNRWASASFHQTFSAAIRRLDHACNIRWI